MRIISSFNEYYDGVQAYGQDMSIIYQRKTIEYDDIKNAPPSVRELMNRVSASLSDDSKLFKWYGSLVDRQLPTRIKGKPANFLIDNGKIVFCGKFYNYLTFTHEDILSSKHYFYDTESVSEFCEKNKMDIDCRDNRWNKNTIREVICKKFDKVPKVDINWLIENKVICALIKNNKVVINPHLKPLQFFKVVDAYTAYSELDMWICGTLAFPQNEMVVLDDKSMIAKHGFDKWSFRKQPEGYGK